MEQTKKINNLTDLNSNNEIQTELRKIVFGRAVERISKAPSGTSGVGTARFIAGFVKKVHSDPTDSEFEEYGGTIDVGDYDDLDVVYKGVMLSGLKDNANGFLIIPKLYSDVTVIMDSGTNSAYVVNYSHADIIQWNSHKEVFVGASETEEFNPTDNDSPDYDQLDKTGNETYTKYTVGNAKTVSKNKNGKESSVLIDPENILSKVDESEVNINSTEIDIKRGGTTVRVSNGKVQLGSATADNPIVLGRELAQLMQDFITECTRITTPTLMGTMPAINIPNFVPLLSRISEFLSKTSFTK